MSFEDALQLIMVSVCTGFGLELAKEMVHALVSKLRKIPEQVKRSDA